MARKKKDREPRQQRIPGTIDAPTEAILRKAEAYVATLQDRMGAQSDENVLRAELIEMMKAGGVETFALDGHTVTLTHSESDKITVKKDSAEGGDN